MNSRGDICVAAITSSCKPPTVLSPVELPAGNEFFLLKRRRWTKLPTAGHLYRQAEIQPLADDDTAFILTSAQTETAQVLNSAFTVTHGKARALPRRGQEDCDGGEAGEAGSIVWYDNGTDGTPSSNQAPRLFVSDQTSDRSLGVGVNPRINLSGQICATDPRLTSYDLGGRQEPAHPVAFLIFRGRRTVIGPGYADDINSVGEVVGERGSTYFSNGEPDGSTTCWLYSHGRVRILGNLGLEAPHPKSLNREGEFVGATGEEGNGAFLYSRGRAFDLNSLVAKRGLSLDGVESINDRGEILAYHQDEHDRRTYFILKPTRHRS